MTGRDGVSGTDARMAPLPEDERGSDPGFHARAIADPAFRARFEAAYAGEDDPLDALWWLDHPEQTAPSGAAAPAALARAARGALYGPGTDPAALERYERATAAAERSRTAAVAALGRLPVRAGPSPPPPAGPAQSTPAAVPALRPRATRVVLAAAVALALVGGAAGFGLGRGTATPVPIPTPTPALTEHFQQTVTEQRATAIFERAPEPADLLGGDLEPLDTVNLRRLVTIGSTRFFGARTTGNGAAMCLIAVEGLTRTADRCVSLDGFSAAGVTLLPADGLPAGFARVRWQPDGRLIWWSPIG